MVLNLSGYCFPDPGRNLAIKTPPARAAVWGEVLVFPTALFIYFLARAEQPVYGIISLRLASEVVKSTHAPYVGEIALFPT